jgi:hypothetical protein
MLAVRSVSEYVLFLFASDEYPTRFITDVLSNIHLSSSAVTSSQSARVMLANKEADLQELAAELKTLELQLRAKGSALRAQQRR